MQINSGFRSVLAFPWLYRLFDVLVGSKAYEEWFIKNILGLRNGQKLVDVGCGPAQILDRLPTVEYVGLDISDAYIQAARTKFKARGGANFLSGNLEDWALNPLTYAPDRVFVNVMLRHVDDV